MRLVVRHLLRCVYLSVGAPDVQTPAEYISMTTWRHRDTYAQEVGQRNTFSGSLMNINVLLGGGTAGVCTFARLVMIIHNKNEYVGVFLRGQGCIQKKKTPIYPGEESFKLGFVR